MNSLQFEKERDAAVLISFGQSNSHGHGTRLPEDQRIQTPMGHVFGLPRTKNQSYDCQKVQWSGYTSFGMNLGEIQDHTCCLATEFARLWQAEIDQGAALPDLYIIQISVGAQGVHKTEAYGWNMWYPDRPPVLKDGTDGPLDISLYPLAIHILNCAMDSFRAMGKTPKILGLHWNQWETEVETAGEALDCAQENYRRIFDGFRQAVGLQFPIYLYRPISEYYQKPEALVRINQIFDQMMAQDHDLQMLDLRTSPLWNPELETKGIFQADLVHYCNEAHRWFAQEQLRRLCL